MPQCTARSKRSNVQCKNHAIIGKTKCKFHGGKSLSGPFNKNYKDGKYSKSLTGKMLRNYEESYEENVELLKQQNELALLDTRLHQLVEDAQDKKGGSTFEDLAGVLIDLKDELQLHFKKGLKLPTELKELEDLIASGYDREQLWEEVLKTVEQRRKVVETEVKRIVASSSVVPAEHVRDVLNNIAEIYKQAVHAHTDQKTANAILVDASTRQTRFFASR